MIILACNSYSAETSNPSASENPKREKPKSFSELKDVVFVTQKSSPRTLFVGVKDDVSYVFWTNATEDDLRANSATLPDDIGMTKGTLVGRRFVPLGSPECLKQMCCSILLDENLKTFAKQLAIIFRSFVTDMNKENAKGGPQKYFIPDMANVFIQIDSEQKKYFFTVVPQSTATKTSIERENFLATWAPEVYEGGPYTEASVVYAYGVILASVISRTLPIRKDDPLKQMQYIVDFGQQKDLMNGVIRVVGQGHGPIIGLLTQCLNRPNVRPTFDTILKVVNDANAQDFRCSLKPLPRQGF
jgi:hypothetical protein